MTILLQIHNLQKSFQGTALLNIESFSIESGECIVLSGRNGSGKSTLLRILSGLIPPDNGEFIYEGKSLTWRTVRRRLQRDVIYVHQQPYMLDRSVAKNIAYGLLRTSIPRQQAFQQVKQALEWAGLTPLADRNARSLSGGEKQRVALTRARILSPKLLLLDEPIANMDMESREHTVDLIRRLRQEGISTIVTTHEPRVAKLLGDSQRHLCMTGPARYTVVKPFLYDVDTAQEPHLNKPIRTNPTALPTSGGSVSKSNRKLGHPMIEEITAVVLAGGKARRMGGEDKGLIDLNGKPMIEYVIKALEPQAGTILISANRNLERYKAYDYPVVTDMMGDYFGPLVGMASAMQITETPYLLTVPCDSPLIRYDLVERLYAVLQSQNAELSVIHDGERMQPVFALLRRDLLSSLLTYLEAGGRKIDTWYNQHHVALADFSQSPDMFLNINTPDEQTALCKKLPRNEA